MNTLLLGSLSVPSKYKEYVDLIRKMKIDGSLYNKEVVDELVERLIEVLDDNYRIREVSIRRKEFNNELLSRIDRTDSKTGYAVYEETELNRKVEEKVEKVESEIKSELESEIESEIKSELAKPVNELGSELSKSTELTTPSSVPSISTACPVSPVSAISVVNGVSRPSAVSSAAVSPAHSHMKNLSGAVSSGVVSGPISGIKIPHDPISMDDLFCKKNVLRIKEELSELSAYAISLLLIGARIEELLFEMG